MDLNTFLFNILTSLLATILFETCKFLLKPSIRGRIKAKLSAICYFSYEKADRIYYYLMEFILIAWPSSLDFIYSKFARVASTLLLVLKRVTSNTLVFFKRHNLEPRATDASISHQPIIYMPNIAHQRRANATQAFKENIISKVVSLGCVSATGLASELGQGVRAGDVRAGDLVPYLDSLVADGMLHCKESGEPGCWHGFKIYELAA
jgi:hypothetical protein